MDDLSIDYASYRVVFLEYPFYGAPAERYTRMGAAHTGGSIYFPPIIVDSGNQYTMGYHSDFAAVYGGMVDTALVRPAQGEVSVQRLRVGDTFEFSISVTNSTGVTLSTANGAAVHAIVYEVDPADVGTDTRRRVRQTSSAAISSLANGATDTFDTVVNLSGLSVDWNQLHSVVIVDYRPGGSSGPWDTMQAAFQP